ncbi:2,4-dichlorophenol 6-monooxygenase (plasmid) [Pantoea sp. JZ29]|uniref:FAD-dependent oxidoreductase n=1 Tax=Pantoea sp. JZ29 TaxID=2654192 RepID=UPI002B46FFEA|nr:FAD-dependent monooxygenase [Pantoea sp. JZ29]WRH23369.1 2,4-dichlorophenol 6-monooxygenase [Pantoea sp. JZ29]
MIETDVLIVGSGPAGGSASVMLSNYGIKNLLITKHRWLADGPRAHYKNQRTMEIFADMNVIDEVRMLASSKEIMGDMIFCTSLTGKEIGRQPYGANRASRMSDYSLASPYEQCDLPQHLLEPVLINAAASRGSTVRFQTEYVSHQQDKDGVTVRVLDRLTGNEFDIRAKYLIGADGGNSKVAQDLELPMEGKMGLAGSLSFILRADLTKYVEHRPCYLWWIMQPGANVGGIGMGLLRMIRPWNEWQVIWGYDINQEEPEVSAEEAEKIARTLIGDWDIPVTVEKVSKWTVNQMHAKTYSRGRVFCMGDAVHRHPPSNGLGCNTSIQDAYNLCWKIAYVLQGKANVSLLETYDIERVPVGRRIVERANKSVAEFTPIFDALGITGHDVDSEVTGLSLLESCSDTAASVRASLAAAISFKEYEFAGHGVEFNQRYYSKAVIDPKEIIYQRDQDLYYQASSSPGGRIPHIPLLRSGQRISTLNIVGHGQFTLITGLNGRFWADAALSPESIVPVKCYILGPGQEIEDIYGEWSRVTGLKESGCLLVRPDGYIAWRCEEIPADPCFALNRALKQILGLEIQSDSTQEIHLAENAEVL